MDPKQYTAVSANPFLFSDAEDLTDDDLRDHVRIYRDLRDRLREGARSALDVIGQVEAALEVLEAEMARRGL